jgi:integrase
VNHHYLFCNTLPLAASTTAPSAKTSGPRQRAGITATDQRLTLHSLRHGFASLLIANASTSSSSAASSGHANVNIRLEVYAHLFQRADHAATARAALDASYATIRTADV